MNLLGLTQAEAERRLREARLPIKRVELVEPPRLCLCGPLRVLNARIEEDGCTLWLARSAPPAVEWFAGAAPATDGGDAACRNRT